MARKVRKSLPLRALVVGLLALGGALAATPVPTALPNLPPSYDANMLIAAPAPATPTIDGTVDAAWGAARAIEVVAQGASGSWPSGAGISVRALYDGGNLYVLLVWADATEDYSRDAWQLVDNNTAGGNWTRTLWGDDAMAVLWDDGQGLEQNFSSSGCGTVCHTGVYTEMHTGAGTLDAWQWSSSRTQPLGYADDLYMDWADKAGGSPTGGWHGDGPDPWNNNTVTTGYGERPSFLNGSVPAGQDARHIGLADASAINWATFNSTSLPKGTVVPGYVLVDPSAERRGPTSGAVWNGSAWVLELARPLATADNASRDLAFDDLNATYFFSLSVFDNKTGMDHSWASFAYKMVFADNALPDLTPEAVTLSQPDTLTGDPVSLTVRVRNMGFGGAAAPTRLAVTDDVSLLEVANMTVPPIASSDFFLANLTFSSSGYAVGLHDFTANVDEADEAAESFEGNNTIAFQVSIIAPPLFPDVVVESATGPSSLLFGGDTFLVNGSVRNLGAGGTGSSFTLRGGHPLFGNRTQSLGPLAPGEAANFSLNFSAAGVPGGAYAITLEADAGDALAEENESNNTAVIVVSVEDRADLVAVDLVANPAAGAALDAITLNLTIENRGAAFAGTVNVWIYLDEGTATNATNRTDVWAVPLDLARGENMTYSSPWGIPALIAPGPHTVRAWVDGSRLVDEFVEANNNQSALVVVVLPPRPDLEVTGLTLDHGSYRPSEQATATVNVTNNGVSYAGSVRLEVIEATLNVSLGNVTVPAIAAGATQSFTVTFAVQPGTAGVHSLLVVVDADGVLDEEAELNNALSTTFDLLNAAALDLTVAGPSYAPAEPTAGDTVTVMATVRNTGSLGSPAATATLRWVATTLGTALVPALSPGQTAAVSFTWNTAGVRSLSAILTVSVDDPTGEDANLGNNEATFVVAFRQPGAPNLHMVNLTVAPASVDPGQQVRIEVRLTNNGTAPGNATVRFFVGGVALPPQNYTVAVGATVVASANWTALGVGNVTVRAELSSAGSTIAALGGAARVNPPGGDAGSSLGLALAVALGVVALAAVAMLLMRRRPPPQKAPAAKPASDPAATPQAEEE